MRSVPTPKPQNLPSDAATQHNAALRTIGDATIEPVVWGFGLAIGFDRNERDTGIHREGAELAFEPAVAEQFEFSNEP